MTTPGALYPPAVALVGDDIPKRIWYKLGPKGLTPSTRAWTDSCLKNNPIYRSIFMTDLSGDLYVEKNFVQRPELVETYLALPIPILKADLLRYLLLFAEGGIWSDLDTSCEGVPIADWVPMEYKKDASLVVGLEFDEGWGDGDFPRQFTGWTIMAKPNSPHMAMVIDEILDAIRNTTVEWQTTVSGLTMEMIGDVVDFTGPRMFSRSVIKSLELRLDKKLNNSDISHLSEPKLIGDVLVLPAYAFANNSNTYEGKIGPVLVRHHYAGSWKNELGGELA